MQPPCKRARADGLERDLRTAGPACVVFDLDHTLWEGNCEEFSIASVLESPTELVDPATGRALRLFPDVPRLFALLSDCRIPIGIASSSPASRVAMRLLQSYGLSRMVAHAEVHAGRKEPHLREIARRLSVPLSKVLFFDDLTHNIRDAERLGCTAVRVSQGMDFEQLRFGLKCFAERKRGSSLMSSWLNGGTSAQVGRDADHHVDDETGENRMEAGQHHEKDSLSRRLTMGEKTLAIRRENPGD
ncbi:hypothetical protein AB1Y20_004616 [Prymnesium parvum]|uniref:Magnesium-dependent phosphatase-1 n=1 Tax=Prymnesium parvum TaxID=97485 RepID=A0AB34IWX5_PRYPA